MLGKQIKSKERVRNQGEVFTNEREVKAMCDLVKQECDRIDSRFLEPACGDGNFLAEILNRKRDVVERRYGKMQEEYNKNSFLACTSIYGVELLADNAEICRKRMVSIWEERYKKVFNVVPEDMKRAVKFVFQKNIVCGNALTLMCVDENQNDTDSPIIFTEWSFVKGNLVKRRDFRLDVLLQEHMDEGSYDQLTLFGDDGGAGSTEYWERDPKTKLIIPKPIREYKPTNYKLCMEA